MKAGRQTITAGPVPDDLRHVLETIFDFDANPAIDPAVVNTLAACDWVRKGLLTAAARSWLRRGGQRTGRLFTRLVDM